MTNQDIGNFLSSIAEAKRAFDAEPGYRSDITRLTNRCEELGETISRRELHIHDLKGEVSSLTSKLREVEAERDDAGFRCLEETDKVQGLLTLVRESVRHSLECLAVVEGGKPMVTIPEEARQEWLSLRAAEAQWIDRANELERQRDASKAELVEVTLRADRYREEANALKANLQMAQEQLAPRPFVASTIPDGGTGSFSGGTESSPSVDLEADLKGYKEAMGQSERDPTPASVHSSIGFTVTDPVVKVEDARNEGQSDGPFAKADTTQTTQSETVYSQPVPIAESVPSPASPPERNRDPLTRFKDRKYYDVTYFVPYHEWIAGGGTEADYHWRPDYGVNRASHHS